MQILKGRLLSEHRSFCSFKLLASLLAGIVLVEASGANYLETGRWLFQRKDVAGAEAVYRRQIALEPLNVTARLALAEVQVVSNRPRATGELLEYARGHWLELSNEARATLRQGNQKLHHWFLTDSAQTQFLQAKAFSRGKDGASALSALKQAMVLEPDNWQVLDELRNAALQAADPTLQLQAVEAMLAIDPWNRPLVEERIFLKFSSRDFSGVVSAYEEAEEPSNNNWVRTAYAASLCEIGRSAQALPMLRELVRVQPASPALAQFYLARALSSSGAGTRTELSVLLRRYLSAYPPVGPNPQDSLRSAERLPEAKKLLNSLWSS